VLDGGIQAWGGPLETKAPHVTRGDFTAGPPDQRRVLDFQAVRALQGVPLIDARAPERYRGEKEPIDPKAGHIPGPLSAPFLENLEADGRFKSSDELDRKSTRLNSSHVSISYA